MAKKNDALEKEAACPVAANASSVREQIFHGLAGSYSAYDHCISTRLFPLKLIAGWTNLLRREEAIPPNSLVIAASYRLDKIFLLDVTTSKLSLLEHRRNGGIVPRRAVPEATPPGTDLHRWLGEMAERLSNGQVVVEPIDPLDGSTCGLSAFPRSGPLLSRAITRGIEVEGSSVYDPVQSSFIYSIRLRMLTPGEPGALNAAERGFETAQLRGRHWILRGADGEEEHVHGDGVVGRYPLLREGGWREDMQRGSSYSPTGLRVGETMEGTFIYQSMSGRGGHVSFGGEILLVPGELRNPTGAEFAVELPPFPLVVPEYIY
uniref:ApaG domain-containing protein n=1 Tax=Haptolina ericina TaxID=156174 RepID=A0A7S3FKK4_9EUKA